MKHFDILFVHPPRSFQKDYMPRTERNAFPFLPMGLFGIANFLHENGFSVKIINVPLEIHYDKNWQLDKYLKNIGYDVCAIDLHWLQHSWGAIGVARMSKMIHPHSKVILGGFSATFYAKEILETFSSIDAIIMGEGEIPILEFMQSINQKKQDFENVKNLAYKENGMVKINPLTYVADSLELLDYSKIDLMDNWIKYIKFAQRAGMPFSVLCARGCPFNCHYCGGGREANYIINRRKRTILLSPERVVSDMKNLVESSGGALTRVYFGHGTYPGSDDYWMSIFRQIRKEKLDLGCELEIWRLPTPKKLIFEFQKTFDFRESFLNFNMQSISSKVREKLQRTVDPTINYNPKDLKSLLKYTNLLKIPLRLWTILGNPFETVSDLIKGLFHVLDLTRKNLVGSDLSFLTCPATISPGSPVFMNPERFDVKLILKTFQDFLEIYRDQKNRFAFMDEITSYETKYLSRFAIKMWNKIYNLAEGPLFIKSIRNLS